MKVIFSHNIPFYLAHGGQQTLIESLMRELAVLGVDVQPERWWDAGQTGDILHFVGRPPTGNVQLAQQKGMKTVMTENFDVMASESRRKIFLRTLATKMTRRVLPGVDNRLSFYRELDAMVYVVPHEWDVVRQMFEVAPEKGSIIAHGLEPQALEALAEAQEEGEYLVSVGTICSRKNTTLLAASAREAKVPIVFLGRPFSDDDPYYQQFRDLVDGQYVRYPGYVSEGEKYAILRGARGSVLLSKGESGCIALYEASAARLPLLLSDLPWARNGYPASDRLKLVPLGTADAIAPVLKSFYATAHRGPTMTFPVGTWNDVARQYLKVYERLLQGRGHA